MNSRALLIIDIQRGFLNRHTKKLPELAESLQNKYELIYVAKLEYGDRSPFLEIRKSTGFCDIDRPTDLAFQPVSTAKTIVKHGYSALNTELKTELERSDIKQIDLMGMDTDQCVLATALALFDMSITPRILSRYCASTGGASSHRAGIKILRRALGETNVL